LVSRYIRTTKTVHMFKKGIAFTLLLAVMDGRSLSWSDAYRVV